MQKFDNKHIKSVWLEKHEGVIGDFYSLVAELRTGKVVNLALFKEEISKIGLMQFVPVDSEVFESLRSANKYCSGDYQESRVYEAVSIIIYFSRNIIKLPNDIVDVKVGRESSEVFISEPGFGSQGPSYGLDLEPPNTYIEPSTRSYIDVASEDQKFVTIFSEQVYRMGYEYESMSIVSDSDMEIIEGIIEEKYSSTKEYEEIKSVLKKFKLLQATMIPYKKPAIQKLVANLGAIFRCSNKSLYSDEKHLVR